jgi:polysaccharide pyruvyl transferase WcaK-like protein
MDDATFERLTILERAQFLYESAQRRHSEALDRHQTILDQHGDRMAALERLLADQQRMQQQLLEVSAKMQTTLEAIKDLLNRPPNGH